MNVSDARGGARPAASKELGDAIRIAREAEGLSREQVARMLGGTATDTTVQRWEGGTGIKAVDFFRLVRLLPRLRMNVAALLRAGRDGDPGFPAWAEFRRTPEGAALTDEMLEALVFFPWTADSDPSVGDYQRALFLLQTARRAAK